MSPEVEEAYETLVKTLNFLEKEGENIVGSELPFDDTMVLVVGENETIGWDRNEKKWSLFK